MARPFWTGQIQISLVSFSVSLFPAVESKSEIRFHQLSRSTGERIRHQKVTGEGEEGPVEKDDIVKGYEYRKGEYVMIEPDEIKNLRIPSKHTLEVTQFVEMKEIDPEYFEKPYFVIPEDDSQAEAFGVVRKALQTTKKVALGKIAFSGREHVIAVTAPSDDKLPGMIAYTMRYAEELRKPGSYFADIKKAVIDSDQLSLAKELIKRKTAKFEPEKFTDQYEAALREMVEAKIKHLPIPQDEPAPKSGKVINLMDALRKSVQGDKTAPEKKTPQKAAAAGEGITLVKASKGGKRKSA
jgi:DNA end-binding protein Ku